MPMIVLGLLSVCQLTFLPGFLVARLTQLDAVSNRVSTWFGLGLIVNYLVVLGLVALHAYSRPVVLALFVAEVAAACWLVRDRWWRPIGPWRAGVPRAMRDAGSGPGRLRLVVFALALLGVLFTIAAYGRQFGETFREWDAVVSWDRWAVDWSRGVRPHPTYHYPQLVPANWSLTYRLIGTTDVKAFARWFMGAFEVAIPLALLIAGSQRKHAGYWLGSILASWLMWQLGSRASGYVDSAVACLALLAVLAAFEARVAEDVSSRTRLLVLGAVLAAGAAVTKQAGLWIAVMVPVMAVVTTRSRTAARSDTWKLVAAILAIEAAVILPWYVHQELAIRAGKDLSEIGAVTGAVHGGRSLAERVSFGFHLLNDALRLGPVPGVAILSLLGLAMAYSCREREGRWLAMLVAPFFAAWLLLWSYDRRNLTLAVPLLALAAGLGARRLGLDIAAARATTTVAPPAGAERARPAADPPRRLAWKSIHLLLLVAAGVALLPLRWSDERLRSEALAKQRRLGDPKLDEMLYQHQAEYGFAGQVLTDYQFLGALPEIGHTFELGYSSQPAFLEQSRRPEVGYVLYCRDWASPQVPAHFATLIAAGKARRVLTCGCWEMVTTCRGPCD